MFNMPRWLRYCTIAGIALGGVCLFLLTISSSDTSFFQRYFPALLVVNLFLASSIFITVVTMVVRLIKRLKLKQFGARMTARLALITALLAVAPCVLIYIVSGTFINRSIDSWFDVRVERALDSGVSITQGVLARLQESAEITAKRMAQDLSNTPPSFMVNDLLKLTEGAGVSDALVVTANGTAVAAAGSKLNVLVPDMPTATQLQAVRSTGMYSNIDGDAFDRLDHDLKIRVIVPIPLSEGVSFGDSLGHNAPSTSLLLPSDAPSQKLYLRITVPVSDTISSNAADLVTGYRDYQELVLSRESLRTIYGITLTLTMLLAAFGAIAGALSFARKATEPVMQLAKGTRRVAGGDFAPIREFAGGDEINALTLSFNMMITQLAEARRSIEKEKRQAEQAQAYLERVLGNISSGVMVIDHDFRIVTANAAAITILGEEVCRIGSPLSENEPELAKAISAIRAKRQNTIENFGFEFEITRNNKGLPLYLRASTMPLGVLNGLVLVFDDVSQLMEAQRATAWGEVARRLAHEIKNPLTPIRLAAERLEMKLEDKISSEKDLALLHRTIKTIVDQVDALKQMVNDFREYARLPLANLQPINLNQFITECAILYHDAGINLQLNLAKNLPFINADISQLRQVLHNLVSNAIDATEMTPQIIIKTEVAHVTTNSMTSCVVRLIIEDNGIGFSDSILNKAFEPYITTKPTGTGLGLPMVKKIIDEHDAKIELTNNFDEAGHIGGACVTITFKACREKLVANTKIHNSGH